MSNFQQYTKTSYAGRALLKKYSLEDYGTWKILGEDPNCDLSGPHSQPDLGTLEGKLEDVIRKAVKMDGFWNWGGGGNIYRIRTGKEDVHRFLEDGIREKALAKLTDEEIKVLGIKI